MERDLDDIDLLDPAVQADPWRAYDLLRARAPVWEMAQPGFFVVTSHAGVAHALGDPAVFSADLGASDVASLLRSADARAIAAGSRGPAPAHDAFAGCFAEPRVKDAFPAVRAIVDDRLAAFDDAGECEFVAAFAAAVPLIVMTDYLGLPLEDLPQIAAWADAFARPFGFGMGEDEEHEVARQLVALRAYLSERVDGLPVTLAESLLLTGNASTGDALGSALWLLLRDPAVLDAVRADGSRLDAFVEEALRLESPLQGVLRRTTREVELLGTRIPEGRLVYLGLGAANRDPSVFPDPHRLDLSRSHPPEHFALGGGASPCPAAPLVRLVLCVALERLLARFDEIALADPEARPAHLPSFTQRGLRELRIRYRVAAG